MLDFSKEFFQAEVRNDFLIDETMKTVWTAELEVLQEIAVICNRHQLTWYAAYGTLIGAVRHEGFIPWDDDIDIMMKREDYRKLLEVMSQELPEEFCVYCSLGEREFEAYHCLVQNSDSISIEPEHLKKFHGCPFMVGVDIFPLDYIPRDVAKREEQKNLFLLIRQAIWLMNYGEDTPENRKQVEKALETINKLFGMKLKREEGKEAGKKLINTLWNLNNRIAMQYGEQDGDHLANFVNWAKWDTAIFNKHWFDEVEYLPFEHVMLPVPKDYDAVLRTDYGDYMVPRRAYDLHDYPVYKKQLEDLRRMYQEKMGEIGQ